MWAANLKPEKTVALPENKLPLREMTFLSDTMLVAAGYDCAPMLFEAKVFNDTVQSWSLMSQLGGQGKLVNDVNGAQLSSQFTSGLAVFKAQSDLGLEASDSKNSPTRACSPHYNCVQCIRTVHVPRTAHSRQEVSTFTTSGLDGMIVLWEVDSGSKG